MKIAFVSSECVPFASTGGLGDVADALPRALAPLDCEVLRIMPMFHRVMTSGFRPQPAGIQLEIPMETDTCHAEIFFLDQEGVRTYFISREEYFDRTELYATATRDYDDNFERFVFFQKAAVALLDHLDWKADVVHCNDWQCGLLPLFLRCGINGWGRNGGEKTVLTIHNLAYQGVFPHDKFEGSNLPSHTFSVDLVEFYGQINMLKAGVVTADRITTVSESYADEILTPAFGCGLEGVLAQYRDKLQGIVNGVDYSQWNPAVDRYLASAYDPEHMQGKADCKRALLEEMGLAYRDETPVFGLVSRLVEQKGLDIISEAMPRLMELDLQIVLLGSGQAMYQDYCREWQERWPQKVACFIGFDPSLAHRVEAGADFYLMPSRFEPCGLNQLYSLKYGTLPLVNNTGGLADTVVDLGDFPGEGTGFKMNSYSSAELCARVKDALELFAHPRLLKQARKRAMLQDFSWTTTAGRYLDLYKDLIGT